MLTLGCTVTKKMSRHERLGNEKMLPLLFKLSTPAIVGMFIQSIYNVVDSIYIGHFSGPCSDILPYKMSSSLLPDLINYTGKDGLSALTLSFPVQMILIAVAVGTGIGISAVISRFLGAKKNDEANNAAEHAIILSLIYGVLGLLAGLFLLKGLMSFYTSDQHLISLSTSYLRIIMSGSIFMSITMISNNILRGEGNTFTPMLAMLIGALLNIILDPIFIFGWGWFPALGIEGAAYATILAQLFSAIFILHILFNKKNKLQLNLKYFKFSYPILKKIFKIGFPAMLIMLLDSVVMGVINKLLSNINSMGIAVVGIYFRLNSLLMMPIFGLAQGYIPIIGYNLGKKDKVRIFQAMKTAGIVVSLFSLLGCLLFQLFPETLIRIFNNDTEMIRLGKQALQTISIGMPLVGAGVLSSTTFQALGQGFKSLFLTIFRQVILLIPLAFILVKNWGLDGIWYSFSLSTIVGSSLAIFLIIKTARKLNFNHPEIAQQTTVTP